MSLLSRHRRHVLKALLGVSIAWGAVSAASYPAIASEPVRIGVVTPLTGPAANGGLSMKQGMELAVEEWNAKGGITIDGEKVPVEAIFEDSQSRPEIGVSATQKLITRDKVDLVIGEAFHSSVTLAIMELASQFNVPILSGMPVSTEIAKKIENDPEKYKLFWKGSFNSEAYGEATFDTYKALTRSGFTPKKKTIAFIIEDTDFGRSNAELVAAEFKRDGWTVIAEEAVPLGYTDFYPQLTKMRALEPDIIYSVFAVVNSGVSLVRQYQELSVNSLHIASYYPQFAEFFPLVGEAAEGLVWNPLRFDPNANEVMAQFDRTIRERFKVDVTSSDHAIGHSTINVAIHAIARAGTRDPQKISDAIGQSDYHGVNGNWAFTLHNHTAKWGPDFIPIYTVQVQDGKNVILQPDKFAKGQYRKQPWLQ